MIAIIDYGLGNLGSILNMLKWIGCEAVITNKTDLIEKADRLILPGVGAFDNGMRRIDELGLKEVLNTNVLDKKKPVLGICLGMQLITRGSEEGNLPGLGWIDAETIRFQFDDSLRHLKVPHMGWNDVRVSKPHPLTEDISVDDRFYFVHSYYVKPRSKADELMSCRYGVEFTCAVQRENIMGVQFHPEKSHRFGIKLLTRFVQMETGCNA